MISVGMAMLRVPSREISVAQGKSQWVEERMTMGSSQFSTTRGEFGRKGPTIPVRVTDTQEKVLAPKYSDPIEATKMATSEAVN